ncbi:class I SAM-dependent methyltransferase [Candidatus Pelagibacter sp.]|nr:class I SAM-dependent methyltransferase [Candidatus Pelagibacter sp.]
MIPKTYKIKKCRLCGNKDLKKIFSYGNFFVSNFVTKKNIKNGIKAPLSLVNCNKCSLLQLEHTAPQEIMYKRFYWYQSGITKTMRDGLKDIYTDSKKVIKLKKGDTVLDIGANDGTFLSYYKKDGIKTIGCEPAKNLQSKLNKNCDFILNDFWSEQALSKILKKNNLTKPKLITAIGMFYDLENPLKFIKDAANSLDKNGIFVAQLMCLDSMIKKNDLGNICHEHLEFYTYKSLKYLFESNGLYMFKVDYNKINGGSYRIYCKKNQKKSINYKENTKLIDIKKFIQRTIDNKNKTINFLKNEIKKNKTIFLYGASTKGNTLLQYYGIDNSVIKYAVERSPEKWGKYTIGTGIKIISEEKARKLNPDYLFVMPYGFIKEFLKREKKWIKNGGKFLLPYPKFKIVT